MKNHDVWVWIETTADGAPRPAGLQLLNPAARLAQAQGGVPVALVMGQNVGEAVQEAQSGGARRIIVVEGGAYARYSTDAYTHAMVNLLSEYAPATVLLGATVNGRDLAPRVAASLKTGLTADCTELEYDREKQLVVWTRPAFGGNLMAEIICPDHRPQMGTVRPGVFSQLCMGENRAEIITCEVPFAKEDIRTKIVDTILQTATDSRDIATAEIVVAGGRGIGGPQGVELLQRLAEAFGGVAGASRAVVESGWMPHTLQIGQTGKVVAPRLYIACGISGAVQHRVGIAADTVVAINSDPEAPIFDIADYGIVGDFFAVAEELIKQLTDKK